jgi:6-phosphogluconolactonase
MTQADERSGAGGGLPGRAVVRVDVDALLDKAAGELTVRAIARVEAAGVFHLALSGGSTPIAMFHRLLIDPNFRSLPWMQTHLWQVDERCVPDDDDRRNMRMIRENLVAQVPIGADQVHAMPVGDRQGDRAYEAVLREALGNVDMRGTPRLDYVLLGVGGDGHTASLFPRSPALAERNRLIVFNDGPTVVEPRPRMTMTHRLINAARTIGVLALGEGKRRAIGRIGAEPRDPTALPITGIEPVHPDAELIWYLDEPAAADLAI